MNAGAPQGTLCGPVCFIVHIIDLQTTLAIYLYIDYVMFCTSSLQPDSKD